MDTTTVASLLLGTGGIATGVFSVVTQVRDRKRSIRKQEMDIQIDETTRVRLAAEAAQINSDATIATERWWKEQFDAVKSELLEEQKLRRRVSKWADEHTEWDIRAWKLALETDPQYPPPPELERD